MARRHGLDWPLINASSLLSASAELLVGTYINSWPANSMSMLACQYSQPKWPGDLDLESGVWVMCDVGYLCANFSLPRPLRSQLRPNVRVRRQTDRQTASSLKPPPSDRKVSNGLTTLPNLRGPKGSTILGTPMKLNMPTLLKVGFGKILKIIKSTIRGSVVTVTDLLPVNLGSTPAGTHESLVVARRASFLTLHPTKIVSMCQ